MHAAHQALGKRWQGSRKGIFDTISAEAVADTGCQTCTAGQEILEQVNCPQSYMIPSSHRIVGITDDSLGIVGAILLRITLGGKTTQHMVYISDNIKGLFLSKTALTDLGIINKSFPSSPTGTKESHALKCESKSAHPNTDQCSCPTRAATPDRPSRIPLNATQENIPRLKDWLLTTFAASAFNTCTQQPLQEMTGAPVNVKFRRGQTLSAVHTTIPVPHHWKKQLKRKSTETSAWGLSNLSRKGP